MAELMVLIVALTVLGTWLGRRHLLRRQQREVVEALRAVGAAAGAVAVQLRQMEATCQQVGKAFAEMARKIRERRAVGDTP